MARKTSCDLCGTHIDDDNLLVAKLFLTLLSPGQTTRDRKNQYNAHMDVGKCCFDTVNKLGKWQLRKSKKPVTSTTIQEKCQE